MIQLTYFAAEKSLTGWRENWKMWERRRSRQELIRHPFMVVQHRQILRLRARKKFNDDQWRACLKKQGQVFPNARQGKRDFLSGTSSFERREEVLTRGALAKWKKRMLMR